MYKRYDLPGANAEAQPDWSIEFIPRAELIEVHRSFRVLKYPRIAGSWRPAFVGHLRSILKALRRVHRRDVVHGDIRLHNMVFVPVSAGASATSTVSTASAAELDATPRTYEARLIDFDFARPEGSAYPARLDSVSDTQRHPDVRHHRAAMRKVHDCHSMLFLLRQFRPCDATLRAPYDEAVGALDVEDAEFLRAARRALKPLADASIEMTERFAAVMAKYMK